MEYWIGRNTYLHMSIGGGFGWVDSQGVPGGQGQDLTYNFFGRAGIRHFIGEHLAIGAGLYYQHFSNRGATDPNPGIDGMGPMVGLTWDF